MAYPYGITTTCPRDLITTDDPPTKTAGMNLQRAVKITAHVHEQKYSGRDKKLATMELRCPLTP